MCSLRLTALRSCRAVNEMRELWGTRAGRTAVAALIGLTILTLIGIVALWPGDAVVQSETELSRPTESAEVVAVEAVECPGFTGCSNVTFRLESGRDEGRETTVATGGGNLDPAYAVGDRLRVSSVSQGVLPGTETGQPQYAIIDFERESSLIWLTVIFALAVVLVGRLRGAASLVGMAAALAVVVLFVVPAIADGTEPVLAALVGSSAIMLVTIPLSHGGGAKAVAAMLGTAAAFGLTALLASVFFDLAEITGFASEEASFLRAGNPELSVQGLVLAGAVVAALGVLDDATVSQASVVVALRRADPAAGFRRLFGRALTVGKDHVSATVNTLILAYAGASLPLLLLFSAEGVSFGRVANSEVVATEIVATLVGSIGIVAAVPITTALAAALAVRLAPDALGEDDPSHSH